jgi:hypothetical protein
MTYSKLNESTYAAIATGNGKILKYNIAVYLRRDEKKVYGICLEFFRLSGAKLFSHRGV